MFWDKSNLKLRVAGKPDGKELPCPDRACLVVPYGDERDSARLQERMDGGHEKMV